MASVMVHLAIVKKVNKHLKAQENLLYLGTIAPDLSKELGNSKDKSHFLDNHGNINLDKFIEKYKYKMWYPYIMGYFIHLYVDKLWEEKFLPRFVNKSNIKLKSGGMSIPDHNILDKLIYDDCTNLTLTLIDKYNINLSIFFNEVIYPKIEVDEVDTKKIDILINKMSVILSNTQKKNTLIFDWKEVIKFVNEASNEIIKYLKSLDF